MSKNGFFLEVVQDFDGSYYANMLLGGKRVEGLPEHVNYNELRDAIRQKTGVVILQRKDMKFQQSGRKKFAYIDATQERKDCRVTLDEMKQGWKPKFDPEPASPEMIQPTAVDDLLDRDKSYRYALLDRMRCDCDYYLGYGNRSSNHLWAGSEKEQIACMKALWNSFPAGDKPEWLSFDKILDYEQKMVRSRPSLSDQIQAASFRTSTAVSSHDKAKETSFDR